MTRDEIAALMNQAAGQAWGTEEHFQRFAALVAAAERDVNSKARAGKPRQLPRLGRGMLHDEQQHCFEMGWKEGAAAVRAAIRARGNT